MRKLIVSAWLGVGWPESTCQTSKSNSDISPFIAVEREWYQSWKLNWNERKWEVLLSDGSLRLKLDKWRCINFLRNLLKWINTRDQLSWDLWNEAPIFFNAFTKENICTTHWGNIAGLMHRESFSCVETSRYFTDGPPHCSKSLITKPFVTWRVRTSQVWIW